MDVCSRASDYADGVVNISISGSPQLMHLLRETSVRESRFPIRRVRHGSKKVLLVKPRTIVVKV